MGAIQVAIMCSTGRPRTQAVCLERLANAGGLFHASMMRPPRIYHAGEPNLDTSRWGQNGFELVALPSGRPHNPCFWRVIVEAQPGVPLLFLENDIWVGAGAVVRAAGLVEELPADAGLVSLFDFRNESTGVRFQLVDQAQEFWGSQAVLFTPAALEALGHLAIKGIELDSHDSWDVWAGRAVVRSGLRKYLHAPSLVQHLGTRSEVWPEQPRPTAENFPEPWPTIEG